MDHTDSRLGKEETCRITIRSSGAPVSVAAGFPRRYAPRRPLNAIVRPHDGTLRDCPDHRWMRGHCAVRDMALRAPAEEGRTRAKEFRPVAKASV
jgi:hypothetical protein